MIVGFGLSIKKYSPLIYPREPASTPNKAIFCLWITSIKSPQCSNSYWVLESSVFTVCCGLLTAVSFLPCKAFGSMLDLEDAIGGKVSFLISSTAFSALISCLFSATTGFAPSTAAGCCETLTPRLTARSSFEILSTRESIFTSSFGSQSLTNAISSSTLAFAPVLILVKASWNKSRAKITFSSVKFSADNMMELYSSSVQIIKPLLSLTVLTIRKLRRWFIISTQSLSIS